MTILGFEEILERVDEYTLYCHYLGYEPDIGISYSSPFRLDHNPSFALFKPKKYHDRELMWKDGAKNWSGDIFELVKRLFPQVCKTKDDAASIVCGDFGLGPFIDHGQRIIEHIAKPKSNIKITVQSKPFDALDLIYWLSYHITKPILDRHCVTAVQWYWKTQDQQYPNYPKVPGYAYRIWDRYMLYFPHAKLKKDKFRNDYDERHLQGFLQLQYKHPLLIITKAKKDVMMFDSFGYEAVAARGENLPISPDYLKHLESRYEKIIMWRDNDGKTDNDKYDYHKVYNPQGCGQKDPSDFCAKYGAKETLLLIKQLTGYEPKKD